MNFPEDSPKVRFSDLESEEEFVIKPKQKPNKVLETDSDSVEESDENKRTLIKMSFSRRPDGSHR